MIWEVNYLPEAEKDLESFDHSQKILINKAIRKVKQNPVSRDDGGYGVPLGHKGKTNLTNFLKIKLRGAGIRVVYKLVKDHGQMLIIVIGIREDDEVYELAQKRVLKIKI